MDKGSIGLPHVAGLVVGVMFFCLASLWLGKPIIPTMSTVHAKVVLPAPEPIPAPDADETGEQIYARICVQCHQASGQGLPPAFPPVAGSSWATQDPETPVRIVLSGLGGPITVAGAEYNMVMPGQGPALDDAQIAKVLTFVRASFGNAAGAVDEALVAKVRAEGRAEAWTAPELQALRGDAAGEAAADAGPAGDAPEGEAAADVAAEPAADPASVAAGKKNYSTVCFTCHGALGDGKGPAGMVLKPPPSNFTSAAFWETRNKASVMKAIKLGGPAVGKSPLMAPFGGQFNDEQVSQLADYVMTFKPAQ